MDINVKLDRTFTIQYNKLKEEFGEDLASLNGFAENQLDYSDFIDNFIDEDTVADSSIDGNSNVSHKDIVTLLSEMPKPHRKLLAYKKIFYEIQKLFGHSVACEWLRYEWIGALYMHDGDTSTFKHYCYKGEELITIRNRQETNKEFVVSFKELQNNFLSFDSNAEMKFDPTINQVAIFPKNLEVLDSVDGKRVWTKIKRIVKHDNDKPMRFLKFANGLSQIVTEDHPIITDKGEIPAKEVTKNHQVFTVAPNKSVNNPDKFMSKDFGWVVGLSLAEGNASSSQVVIAQQLNTAQYEKLCYILQTNDIPYTLSGDRKIYLRVSEFEKWLHSILDGKTSSTKELKSDFMTYPEEFLDGIIAGLIDGDGTLGGYKNRQCSIRIASEKLLRQIDDYLRYKGIFTGHRTPHIYNRNGSFKQKLPMYGLCFTLTNEQYFSSIGSIKIQNKYNPIKRKCGDFKNKKYIYDYGWVPLIDNTEYIENVYEVYDITTDSGHFICNNILSHNCFAYDLKDLAEKGLYFTEDCDGATEPAKHLTTFVDFVKEYIGFASNRSSGAVGLPNLIPYMYYFWKKDCDIDYMGIKTTGKEEQYARQNFQRFIYAVNQPYVRDGQQSAFTNTSVFDRPYFEALFGGSEFPDGTFMIDYEEEIIEFQKLYMTVMSEIREKKMFTFPVSSISLLRQDGEFADNEFATWAIKHNMRWSDSNLFIDSSVTSLSNCCRLKSNIEDLGYFNSVGGTALKVGSVKVSTINLARLSLDSNSEEDYITELKHRTWINLCALHAVRHIITRNVEKGLLPNFTKGLVDFEHLYNTTGFIGIFETMKRFGHTHEDEFGNIYYNEKASALGKLIFESMREVFKEFKETYSCDYMINTEQIPGESAAAKLMKKDKLFYPDANIYDLPLYGNQFIPLGIKTTIQERVRIAAEFDGYCNGGSILHVNIDSPFKSFEAAWKMANYIADSGVTYFAFNTKINVCKNGHAFYGDICPTCGCPVDSTFTRIVGFYTKIKTWAKERLAEFSLREWHPNDR